MTVLLSSLTFDSIKPFTREINAKGLVNVSFALKINVFDSFYTQEFSSLSGSKLNHVRDIDLSRDDEE